jgi:hypothetical protein
MIIIKQEKIRVPGVITRAIKYRNPFLFAISSLILNPEWFEPDFRFRDCVETPLFVISTEGRNLYGQ